MASVSPEMMPHNRVKKLRKTISTETKVTQNGESKTPADKCNEWYRGGVGESVASGAGGTGSGIR
jgi:hypothetical protein